MLPDPIYIRSAHKNAFRRDQWAEILRVELWNPLDGRPQRMVYHVRFPDMAFDRWPIYDEDSLYEFTTERPEEFQKAKRQWLASGSMPWFSPVPIDVPTNEDGSTDWPAFAQELLDLGKENK